MQVEGHRKAKLEMQLKMQTAGSASAINLLASPRNLYRSVTASQLERRASRAQLADDSPAFFVTVPRRVADAFDANRSITRRCIDSRVEAARDAEQQSGRRRS